MTPEEFIKWLDEEIQWAKELKNNFKPQSLGHRSACDGIAIFTKVKENFLSLTSAPISPYLQKNDADQQ